MPKYDDQELITRLANSADNALNTEGTEISDTRERLLARYHMKYERGTRGEQYSKYKTAEVFETVEDLLPGLVKAFVASGNIIAFDPINEMDTEKAEFESKVVNHLMLKANNGDGFLELYCFFKDMLLYPNSYMLTEAETTVEALTREAHGLTIEEVTNLMEDEAIELTESSSETMQEQDQQGNPIEVNLYDITYKETRERVKLGLQCVPPEDVALNKTSDTTNLANPDFVGVRTFLTKSDLMKMDYPEKKVKMISTSEELESHYRSEKIQRLFYAEQEEFDINREDTADRKLVLWRFWTKIDQDNDGIAELREIHICGDQVLRDEGTDRCPVSAMSYMINPHVHVGTSPAQAVENLEDMNTFLHQLMLDSIYKSEVGKTFINQRSMIPGDLTTRALYSRASEFVFMQGDPKEALYEMKPDPLVMPLLPLFERIDNSLPMRAGTKSKQVLDLDAVDQARTGAVEGALEKASERAELGIRIAAETGIKSIARNIHYLCRKYPDLTRTVLVNGKWQDAKAEDWPERLDVSVRTGLGYINPEKKAMAMEQLLAVQERVSSLALSNPVKVFNALQEYAEAKNVGVPTRFFVDPTGPEYQPPQPPPPDPMMITAQAGAKEVEYKHQEKMAEIQTNQQIKQVEIQSKQAEMQTKQQQAASDLRIKMMQLQMEAKKQDADIDKIFAEIDKIMAEIGKETAAFPAEDEDTRAATELKRAQAVAARRPPPTPKGGE